MSLLIVNCVEITSRVPEMLSAEILLGGRPEQVVLALSTLIEYVRMPDTLECHRPAQKAVIDLMMRRHRGGALVLPADLSDVVRHASVPWPAPAPAVVERAAREVAASAVEIEIERAEHDQPEAGLMTVHLNFGRTPATVIVDARGGSQEAPLFRFVDGVHPWQLTPAEQWALLRALVGALTTRPT